MNHEAPSSIVRRLNMVRGIILVIALIFASKLFDYQVVQADAINEISYEKRAVTRIIPAVRGTITDANGEVLATTVYRYDVNVAPHIVGPVSRVVNGQSVEQSVEQLAGQIAALIDEPLEEILPKFEGDAKYANLKKRVDATTYRQLRALNIPWLFFDALPHRLYPNGAVAGNVLGFVGTEGTALEGLELMMNSCLAGIDGQETFERGVDGIKIPSSAVVSQPAKNGSNVELTIDADLQYYAQQVLATAVMNSGAQWGLAMVMEAKTGRILVAAEAPSVDPNDPTKVRDADRRARVFQTAYEPGSVVKPLTAAMLVDQGVAGPETQVVAPYSIRIPYGRDVQVISDSWGHKPLRLTLTGVLRDSSNTGIVQLGRMLDEKVRYSYLDKFGFGEKTGLRFKGESAGSYAPLREADEFSKNNVLYGQAISTTMLQMASAYQVLANGGVRVEPRLIDACVDESGNRIEPEIKAPERVLSESAADTTVAMMEKVIEQGSIGRYAGVPGYRVAGKSGTGQIADPNGRGGYGSQYAISFMGMAPAEDPQFVVTVTLYKPIGAINSFKATEPFRTILQQTLRHYRVPPSTTESANIATEW